MKIKFNSSREYKLFRQKMDFDEWKRLISLGESDFRYKHRNKLIYMDITFFGRDGAYIILENYEN